MKDAPSCLSKRSRFGLILLYLGIAVGSLSAQDEESLGRQAEQAGKLRVALTHYVAALQANSEASDADQRLREKIIALVQRIKPTPSVPEEARRQFVMGNTFMKNAKSPADYSDAVREYRQALVRAPWFADAYNNLGIALEESGDYAGAKRMLNLYLKTKPSPSDIRSVQDRMYEIDAKETQVQKQAEAREAAERAEAERRATAERAERERREKLARLLGDGLSGTWNCDPCNSARVSVSGHSFTAWLEEPSTVSSICYYSDSGACLTRATITFDGTLNGLHIGGTATIPRGHENKKNCDLPSTTESFSGTIGSDGTSITLNFHSPKWNIQGSWMLFGAVKYCTNVQKAGEDDVSAILTR